MPMPIFAKGGVVRRRGLFLALLSLAACTADLPTEPSREGPSLQLALPPIPAPPEELTGDLTGGDGFGGLIELGVYASPVLSRITVTGLLTYQGTGSGYLAGNGQIDAAGFFIPNQCSLIVKVRQVNASGGQVIGGPVNCPAHPTQQGSYENYAVVNGSVSAYQTAGPPGSCWRTAPPCISISGSRSVSVEPLDAELVLTPNKVVVAAGGGIVVTAKAALGDPVAGNPAVPFTFRTWSWEGQGPEVGGGHTKVCAAYNTNQCTVQMYQSGNLVGTAIVNGRLKEQRVFLAVVGGDSVPTPPDDSLPEDPPGDSLPGGGGGGGGGGGCSTLMATLGVDSVPCEDPQEPEAPAPTISLMPELGFFSNVLPGALNKTWGAPNSLYWVQLADTTVLVIQVDSAGSPLKGRSVTVALSAVDSSGTGSDAAYGHFHQGTGSKPIGSYSAPHGLTTDSTGQIKIVFRSSAVSGPVRVRVEASSSVKTELVLAVGIPNLQELVERSSSRLIGSTASHPNNHFVTARMAAKLDSLADTLFVLYGVRSEYNDASLGGGGKFDLNEGWSGDHVEHRLGRDVDFRTFIWTESRLNQVKLLWQNLGGTVHDEIDTESPHYHLRYRGDE
jgi:hypothetical protein